MLCCVTDYGTVTVFKVADTKTWLLNGGVTQKVLQMGYNASSLRKQYFSEKWTVCDSEVLIPA